MREQTIGLHQGTCAGCGHVGMLAKGGCCIDCVVETAKKLIGRMDKEIPMDADTATKLLADAKATERQIETQDKEIVRLKDLLKEAKELRETLVMDLRGLVRRDAPLLDAVT